MGEDLSISNGRDDQSVGADAPASVSVRWKRACEPPPFTKGNSAIIALLKSIVDGSVKFVPKVSVSCAVAVQIFQLIIDPNLSEAQLKGIGSRGFYTILASLANGSRTEPPSTAEALKLWQLLSRPAKGGREPGLALRFRENVKQRRYDHVLKHLTLEEARRSLFIRWESEPLQFAFIQHGGRSDRGGCSVSSGGGGGGGDDGGGGSGDAVAGDAPDNDVAPTRAVRPADLDIRVQAFAAASVQRAFFSYATEVTLSRAILLLYCLSVCTVSFCFVWLAVASPCE